MVIIRLISYRRRIIILNALTLIPQLICMLVYSKFNARHTRVNRGMLPVASIVNLSLALSVLIQFLFLCIKTGQMNKQNPLFWVLLFINLLLAAWWAIAYFEFDSYSQKKAAQDQA